MARPESSLALPRKVWTREEAHALVDSGFPNAAKLELVEGELIARMGKKRPHVILLTLVAEWLRTVFGAENVETESPTDVAERDNAHSEPEPALKVLRRPVREYAKNPLPQDLLLVIEVSDSTLQFDLRIKGPLYARAGILEYWVIDIPHRQVHVHRDPLGGAYQQFVRHGFDEGISPLAAPDALFCAERL